MKTVNARRTGPIRLAVYVQPGASSTALAGLHDGLVKIRISAPAVENAANEALIAFVAGRLNVAKRAVRIVAGAGGRRKLLEIDGVSAEQLWAAFPNAQGVAADPAGARASLAP